MWLSKNGALSLANSVIHAIANELNVPAGVAESDGVYYYVWQAPSGSQLYYEVKEETIKLVAKNLKNQKELIKYIQFSLVVRFDDNFCIQEKNWDDDDWFFFSELSVLVLDFM